MKRSVKTFTEQVLFWKLAILKCSGKAIMAGITSIVASLNGITSWNDFTPTQQFIVLCTGLGSMWLVVDSFLDQSMARLNECAAKELKEPETTVALPEPAEIKPNP